MPRRRPFGTVHRRRRTGTKPDGSPQAGFYPGWYLRVRRGGKEISRYAGRDRKTALDALDRLQRETERRELLGEEPVVEQTFEDAVQAYLAWARPERSPTTYQSVRNCLENTLKPHFEGRLLSDITKPDILRFLATRRGVKPATRNRYISILSVLFRHAKENGITCQNPALELKRSKETITPLPLLNRDQQEMLLQRIPEERRTLFVALLDTGARLGEMLRLEWTDLDLPVGTILIREAKSGRPRRLQTTLRLQGLLRTMEAERTVPLRGPDRVFAAAQCAYGGLREAWRMAYKRAAATIGRPELRVHDLRHLAAINLVRAGMDIVSIKSFLGHRNLISTLRYAEYADDAAAARAARLLDTLQDEAQARPS